MSDFMALVVDSRDKAQEARLECIKMQREHLVELEDCVVSCKADWSRIFPD